MHHVEPAPRGRVDDLGDVDRRVEVPRQVEGEATHAVPGSERRAVERRVAALPLGQVHQRPLQRDRRPSGDDVHSVRALDREPLGSEAIVDRRRDRFPVRAERRRVVGEQTALAPRCLTPRFAGDVARPVERERRRCVVADLDRGQLLDGRDLHVVDRPVVLDEEGTERPVVGVDELVLEIERADVPHGARLEHEASGRDELVVRADPMLERCRGLVPRRELDDRVHAEPESGVRAWAGVHQPQAHPAVLRERGGERGIEDQGGRHDGERSPHVSGPSTVWLRPITHSGGNHAETRQGLVRTSCRRVCGQRCRGRRRDHRTARHDRAGGHRCGHRDNGSGGEHRRRPSSSRPSAATPTW